MTEKKNRIPMDPAKVKRILHASLAVFSAHSYRGAKTDEIAEQAEVSKGIIFRYYGDKAHLYIATLKFATDNLTQVVDYSVWQDARSLDEMIVNATKYKIQLQLQFPNEFKLLLDAYAGLGDAPAKLKHKVTEFYANQTNDNIGNLIDPILDRLAIRDDVDKATIQRLMVGMMDQVAAETKTFMQDNPEADLTDFDKIITHVRQYIDILEHGFLKKS
ncbi:Transcriptional regulator, TetR family [Pediococcus damnosus]|uniref:Transcriptional regulator, TetR family n=1 Tax=Pediococcus damnosus TaxID=51663 RepID=A0A0R2HW84_9LACO|nr:TetR/AcrR family transcriptional regulator [Pediococcus damnosus]AMV60437.1 Transcriptional regulator, TetR family [Pediococcus damnosus]AMV63160.1 Transcriptional regulator, TetR family [Pediococcus damnosus]AMV64689.1 Transcriptional regulator, TetR family [Pediococcus damnosus]AMV66947.1 Transcriptional regulator, TetR family [Pediococcus damnosus]AMV69452.1 Transcriptional regulator, TetR family [Pediococcus damnosus]